MQLCPLTTAKSSAMEAMEHKGDGRSGVKRASRGATSKGAGLKSLKCVTTLTTARPTSRTLSLPENTIEIVSVAQNLPCLISSTSRDLSVPQYRLTSYCKAAAHPGRLSSSRIDAKTFADRSMECS